MITTVSRKNNGRFKNMPDILYSPVVNGRELNMLAETHDIALLIGIGYRYDGTNSKFVRFACRMLNIKTVWTD